MFVFRKGLRVKLALLLFLSSSYSSSQTAPSEGPPQAPPGWDRFGEGVSIDERTTIGSILARPDQFNDRPVSVEGKVVEVCRMMGCWMELESDTGKRLRIKVEDGVIIFPQNASGKRSIAQGTVKRLTFTRAQYLARARHEAEEMGREFDPQAVHPPYEEILLWGTGALLRSAPPSTK